jgi:hypothetical protein
MTIQFCPDLARFREAFERALGGSGLGFFPMKNSRAKGDAVVANIDAGSGDQFFYLRMAFAAE